MNRMTLACTALSISALLLAALLVLQLQNHGPVARAAMIADKGDFVTLTTRTRQGHESLFVIDTQTDMLVVYDVELRGKSGRMEPIVKESLSRLFNFGTSPTGSPGPGGEPPSRDRTPR